MISDRGVRRCAVVINAVRQKNYVGTTMIQEFKDFIAKGNVMDMAVGIIMGAAFGTIVKSLVGDIFMPIVGYFTGGLDFTNMFIALGGGDYATLKAAQDAGAATINIGLFINALIAFIIVAWIGTKRRTVEVTPEWRFLKFGAMT